MQLCTEIQREVSGGRLAIHLTTFELAVRGLEFYLFFFIMLSLEKNGALLVYVYERSGGRNVKYTDEARANTAVEEVTIDTPGSRALNHITRGQRIALVPWKKENIIREL